MSEGRAVSILFVDLTRRTHRVEPLPVETERLYLGGRGLGAYLLAHYLPPNTAALDPANPVILSAGPLQGTKAPFSGKAVLTCKSPLTGIYLFTVGSGNLGHDLVRSGYRALVITGRCDEPSFLWMYNGSVEIRPARSLWGVETSVAQSVVLREVGGKGSVAVIGLAGEKGVSYACVISGGERMRAFGRGGAGAVLGSKNLKAVAVCGTGAVTLGDGEGFRVAARQTNRIVAARPEWVAKRRRIGTTSSMESLQKYGMLPARNWQRGATDDLNRMAPERFTGREQWCGETLPCAPLCPAPCARGYRVTGGALAGQSSEGPDYETIYALGINCGLDRFDAVVAADRLCDELGLDTISAGLTLSFFMECRERGLVSKEDLDGVDLRFGDEGGILSMLPRIAAREGIGDLLARGVRQAAQEVGRGSGAFAMHVKGLELGGWGCRGANGQALQYALGSRGGCHHDLGIPAKLEWSSPDAAGVAGKGRLVLGTAADRIVHDSAVICSFSDQYADMETLAGMYSGVWGTAVSPEELLVAGERILNLERLMNVREGITREQDRLPARLTDEPLPDGPRAGAVVPLEALKDEFYTAAGWDRGTGIPLPATLDRLGIGAGVRLALQYPADGGESA